MYTSLIIKVFFKSVQLKIDDSTQTLTEIDYAFVNNIHTFISKRGKPANIIHSSIGELYINNVQITDLSNPFTVAAAISNYIYAS